MRWRSFGLGLLVFGGVVAGCGDAETPPSGTGGGAAAEAWWVLEVPGFRVADGGPHPTGHGWTLEYSNGPSTLQITAFDQAATVERVLPDSEVVGQATVEGFELILRRWRGIPEDEIPPSIGADWKDQGVLLLFGSTKDELELRSHLNALRRVDRARWDAEVAKAPTPQPWPPGPTSTLPPSPTTVPNQPTR